MSVPAEEQSSFIVIGSWNPAIINHHWLKKHFPEKIPDAFSLEVPYPTIVSVPRINYEKILIDPNNGRLVITPKVMNEEIFQYISALALGIYELLAHTPIVASGCNFVFKLEQGEYFKIDEIEQDDKIIDIYEGLTFTGKSVRHTFGLVDCSVNVFYDYVENDKTLRLNFDYKGTRTVEKATQALVENYKYSLELVDKLTRRK
ncbi:MAG: hypothetical protein HQK99_13020 [Nitrospirae bacterium]|nr:hypothetical protein [Nitrospirota bacterium]